MPATARGPAPADLSRRICESHDAGKPSLLLTADIVPLPMRKDHGGSSPANPDGHQQFPEPFGIETYAGSSAKLAAKPNKKKERITIGVLCVALLLAIVICAILAILLACSKSGASKNDLAATAMLSSSPKCGDSSRDCLLPVASSHLIVVFPPFLRPRMKPPETIGCCALHPGV